MSRSRVRGPHAGALVACALLAALLGCAEAFAPSIMGLAASQYCSRVSKRGPACAIGAHHVISAWGEGSALSPSLRTRRQQQHGQLLAMSPSLDDFGDGTEQQDQASSSDLPSMRKALQSTKKAEAPADMHKALRACPAAATKGGGMDDVWGIVSNLEAKGAAPSLMAGMLLLETAIELALRGRADLKDGAKIEEWVRTWGGVPDTAFYARLLDLGAKAPNVTPSDGFALLEKMKRLGVAPNIVTYTSLMDLLAKRGASLSEGESVLADMEEEGVRPTNKTYTALLCIIQAGSGGATFEDGEDVLMRIAESGHVADTSVYNALLGVAARCNGGAEDAEILVQRMREDGIPLDEVTYLAIIDCVSRRAMRGEASLDDAWAVVDEMKAMGIEPTARTYGALISVCTRICLGGGDVSLSDSEEIMLAMKEDGKGPDIDVYANHIELIAKLAGRGRACFQDGLAVLQDIKKCGLQPGPKVFNVLMDVVAKDAKNGKVRAEDGFGVLDWMGSFGVAPDTITFNTLMDVCAKAALSGRAKARHGQKVLDLMEMEGTKIDAVTVTSLLNLAKADGSRGAVEYARAVFDHSERECKNERAYTALIGALSRVRMHDEAVATLKVARDEGIKPNGFMFNAAMGACEAPDDVLRMFDDMSSCGVRGDQVTQRIVQRARSGAPSPRKPVMPDDPLLRAHSSVKKGAKDGFVNL